jgi:hypothetical protein
VNEEHAVTDRSDPGARALARLERLRARDLWVRIGTAVALTLLGVALPLAAEPITGDPGATVGAIVAALLLVALAVAVWPYEWTREEYRHRTLDAIWHEVRTDADVAVPWERDAAWAAARAGSVELARLACAPASERIAGAPSPYSSEVVRRLDADDVAPAAEAMEKLRAEAWELELEAQQRHADERAAAERAAEERMLRELDEAAAADLKAKEERLKREMAQQEAAERRAQAEAVAKALRRP